MESIEHVHDFWCDFPVAVGLVLDSQDDSLLILWRSNGSLLSDWLMSLNVSVLVYAAGMIWLEGLIWTPVRCLDGSQENNRYIFVLLVLSRIETSPCIGIHRAASFLYQRLPIKGGTACT